MSGQQSSPVYKLRWVLSTTAASIMAGSVRMKCAACRKSWKKRSQVANEPINVFCAGRTDAGVHGTGQVVHFETTALRKDAAWTLG